MIYAHVVTTTLAFFDSNLSCTSGTVYEMLTKILHISKCSILNVTFIVILVQISFLVKTLAILLVEILSSI